jgi:hypothetical protein
MMKKIEVPTDEWVAIQQAVGWLRGEAQENDERNKHLNMILPALARLADKIMPTPHLPNYYADVIQEDAEIGRSDHV